MDETLLKEGFDFDAWAALARSDPDGFEQQRVEVIERFIQRFATDQERSRRQQCRIDLERRKAKVPLKACLRLSNLMWESFDRLHGELVRLQACAPRQAPPNTARILPFAERRRKRSAAPPAHPKAR